MSQVINGDCRMPHVHRMPHVCRMPHVHRMLHVCRLLHVRRLLHVCIPLGPEMPETRPSGAEKAWFCRNSATPCATFSQNSTKRSTVMSSDRRESRHLYQELAIFVTIISMYEKDVSFMPLGWRRGNVQRC